MHHWLFYCSKKFHPKHSCFNVSFRGFFHFDQYFCWYQYFRIIGPLMFFLILTFPSLWYNLQPPTKEWVRALPLCGRPPLHFIVSPSFASLPEITNKLILELNVESQSPYFDLLDSRPIGRLICRLNSNSFLIFQFDCFLYRL